MSEYYAVQRSGDSLSHYGVKGMRWGVKKALATGSAKKLGRAYNEAQKHLNKLKDKANIEKQKAIAGVQGKKALRAGLTTAGVGGVTAGGIAVGFKNKTLNPVYGERNWDGSVITREGTLANGSRGKLIGVSAKRSVDALAALGGAAVTAAGLAKTAHHVRKALTAKYRMTKKGHAKAVAKANKFKSEMNKTFGTPYAQKLMSQYKEKKSRKRR